MVLVHLYLAEGVEFLLGPQSSKDTQTQLRGQGRDDIPWPADGKDRKDAGGQEVRKAFLGASPRRGQVEREVPPQETRVTKN